MSDRYSRLFASYAAAISFEDLPAETVHETRRRIIDSIGVAMAALGEGSPVAARRYASALPLAGGATLWGTGRRCAPEAAGFANGVAVRYLDFNDTYLSLEPLHPSDVIPPLMALAEWRGSSPRELFTAIAIAYEISVTLCDAASLRSHGWDHVNYIAIGVACGAGRMLGLSADRIEDAISLAVIPHASMRQTRAGELSMWKGAAAANSARNALFATLMAEAGMTGPYQPFEGEMGFFRELLDGNGFDDEVLVSLERREPPRRMLDTYIKFWPVEYHAQSAVDAALQLRDELGDPGSIDHVKIETFKASFEIIAKDPEKWDPKTRETADHSLQYIVCAALMDGEVTMRTFDLARIRDPETLAMLRERVALEEDAGLTSGYPAGIPNRITVTTADGSTFTKEVAFPRGHSRNPMTDEEVRSKFETNVAAFWEAERSGRVASLAWELDSADSVDGLIASMTKES